MFNASKLNPLIRIGKRLNRKIRLLDDCNWNFNINSERIYSIKERIFDENFIHDQEEYEQYRNIQEKYNKFLKIGRSFE